MKRVMSTGKSKLATVLTAVPTLTEDRDAIRDLLARMCLYRDTQASDSWVTLFTEDAELHVQRDPVVGRDALRAYAERALAGMHHMLTNHVIDVDGDTATAVSSLFVTRANGIHITARVYDQLRRVDESWYIARRSYIIDPR